MTKKLFIFTCEDQDFSDEKQGIIKTIVCRDSFVCRDTQSDEGIKYNSICNVMLLTENINLLNSSMLQRSIVVSSVYFENILIYIFYRQNTIIGISQEFHLPMTIC